ncbi:MAG TPA: DUF4351 domain-containing protein [Thermoanaerobaculia bacterium]|jgi:hypothetical protein|nr:DUF4351 domain-containing protein [Thermoanaerobaculia bacterium]
MTRHDQLFKDLFRTFFPDLLLLADVGLAALLPADPGSGSVTFLDKEVFLEVPEGRRREADLVAALSGREPPRNILIHVEIERRFCGDMGYRLWRYSHQLYVRYALPVVSIVVFLRGGPPGGERIDYFERASDWEVHRFRYLSFGLSKLPAQALLERPEPLAWALAALAHPGETGRAKLKLELLRKIAKASLREGERFLLTNCVETYLQLAGREAEEYTALRLAQKNPEVEAMELTWEDRMAIQYTQKGIEKGVKKGLRQGVKQGVKKGIQQGVREGIEQGVRDTLLRLLAKRFGKVSQAVRGRIGAIESLDELRGLVERILEVNSIEELGLGS